MIGKRFSDKIAFGSFTNNTFVTLGASVWTNRDISYERPFKECIVVNNLDQDVNVYLVDDVNEPITTIEANGGAFTFSQNDLMGTYYPVLVRNESGSDATSGNVVITMVR